MSYVDPQPSRIAEAIFFALVIREWTPRRVGLTHRRAGVPAATMETALRLCVVKGLSREEVDAVRTAYRLG